jgi:fructose-bisphosphate aldolase class I
MDTAMLEKNASALVGPGRGILAADESTGTMSSRLSLVGVESTAESRRAYRANLFSTEGAESAISGVILYDETIRQNMDDGQSIPDYLTSRGILPGIKVDTGAKELAGSDGEKVTEGLDGLRERCAEYFQMGARFVKWRAVIRISESEPTPNCVHVNSHALARYAAISQEQGLVPIIEPEVLMEGNHDAETCMEVTAWVLDEVWEQCMIQGVHLPGVLLKPNMIISGKSSSEQSDVDKVAKMTVDCLTTHVPAEIPGIVFLSGGQSDLDATAHLNAMNAMDVEHPWQLSYSYGRALQAAALQSWAGQSEEANAASRGSLSHRAKMNSLARNGDWSMDLEE